MKLKSSLLKIADKNPVTGRMTKDGEYRIRVFAAGSFVINMAYALYNAFLGVTGYSVWFLTMAAYYLLLGFMRLYAVLVGKWHPEDKKAQYRAMRRIGILLLLLTFVLTGDICLSLKYDLMKGRGTTVMITIAAYTFCNVISAVMNWAKARGSKSPCICAIRSISAAVAAVSVLNLQMSMFASFGEDEKVHSHLMNILCGAAVCLVIVMLGINMMVKSTRSLSARKGNENG
ncbi:MAG: hypothetical protein LKJ86_10180 [Oscillibacter sp.]|nr:hypothetical protein [Oscillibacter sp.]